jgi:hypothetical protein
MPYSLIRNCWLLFLSLAIAFALSACGGTDSASVSAGGEGASVSVLFTDAPIDEMSKIEVGIMAVNLLGDEEPLTIFTSDPPKVFDLLSLTGESAYLGTKDEVPAGCYEKIRLEIEFIELFFKDERDPVLLTGNELTANGKLDLNPRGEFCLADGEHVAIQLDMDAKALHIVETANGKYIVRPQVFVDILRDDFSGKLVRLSGQVEEIAEEQDAFLLCPPLLTPSSLQNAREISECLEVGTAVAAIFDSNGDAVSLAALSPGVRVEVLGRLRLSDPPLVFEVARAFDAVLVEIGTYQKLTGILAAEPDEQGNFALELAPGQGYPDNTTLDALLFEATRIYSCQGDPLQVEDLVAGQTLMVDGIYDPDAQILKTALIIVPQQ